MEDEPEVLLEVGGPVDELSVTLAIYGEDLEPLEIEKILDVTPTSAHRRGDRKPRGPEFKEGAYVVAVRATSPEEVGRVLDDLLGQVPDSDGAACCQRGSTTAPNKPILLVLGLVVMRC